MKKWLKNNVLCLAWVQALVATLGSLYFSEVMKLVPCTLCWYQRILMYPLVIIIAVGIRRKDKGIYWYVLPMSVSGGLIALYHNLLYYGIIPENVYSCSSGVSCTTRLIEWWGFVTIPLLSLTAFIIITICMVIYRNLNKS